MHKLLRLKATSKLIAVAIATGFTSSCASLAHEKTRQLCAAEQQQARTHCLVINNATVLRAEQDYADYAERFNTLAADPAVRKEYRGLQATVRRLKGVEQRSALRQLGSLNQWLERQAGLELHPWHEYSPRIRRLVASGSAVGASAAAP